MVNTINTAESDSGIDTPAWYWPHRSVPTYDLVNPHGTLRDRFLYLIAVWKDDTQWFNDPSLIEQHRSFDELLKIGDKILPYILDEIKYERNGWHTAFDHVSKNTPLEAIQQQYLVQYMLLHKVWRNWTQPKNNKTRGIYAIQ